MRDREVSVTPVDTSSADAAVARSKRTVQTKLGRAQRKSRVKRLEHQTGGYKVRADAQQTSLSNPVDTSSADAAEE